MEVVVGGRGGQMLFEQGKVVESDVEGVRTSWKASGRSEEPEVEMAMVEVCVDAG